LTKNNFKIMLFDFKIMYCIKPNLYCINCLHKLKNKLIQMEPKSQKQFIFILENKIKFYYTL
jgi:hypothetical protein